MRITPANIVSLKKGQIFVFGSNMSGIHGAGAALLAKEKFGAITGAASGLQGISYAIPTKDIKQNRPIDLDFIRVYVDSFIKYSKDHPGKEFLVTEIGCGLSGYTPEQIAPLFEKAINLTNVFLPERFWRVLAPEASSNDIFRVIIAGGRDFAELDLLYKKCDKALKNKEKVEIVSGVAKGADKIGEEYAAHRGHQLKQFPADWETHGKSAGYIRNELMAKYADALIAFWNGKSRGTKHMIDLANKHGLKVKVYKY